MNTCLLSFHFFFFNFFIFWGEGVGILFTILCYIVVRFIAHLFRFSNNLNCVEEIIKKKKNLIQCTKLLLLRGLGKVMINNFIYFKHTKQSNISFHKKFFLLKLDFSTVSDFKCFIIVSLGQKQ